MATSKAEHVFSLATNELADGSSLPACFACFGRSGPGWAACIELWCVYTKLERVEEIPDLFGGTYYALKALQAEQRHPLTKYTGIRKLARAWDDWETQYQNMGYSRCLNQDNLNIQSSRGWRPFHNVEFLNLQLSLAFLMACSSCVRSKLIPT